MSTQTVIKPGVVITDGIDTGTITDGGPDRGNWNIGPGTIDCDGIKMLIGPGV